MSTIHLNGVMMTTPASSRSTFMRYGVYGVQRQPTDALFYANVTLQNGVVGSRYWIAQTSDLSNVLATGTISTSEDILTNIPAYATPMLMTIRIRKAGYEPFETQAYLVPAGTNVYIIQQSDTIYQ